MLRTAGEAWGIPVKGHRRYNRTPFAKEDIGMGLVLVAVLVVIIYSFV